MSTESKGNSEQGTLTPNIANVARSAYNAYGWNRHWKDWRGGPMPKWDGLSAEIQTAWMVASQQAIDVANGGSYGLDIESKWIGVVAPKEHDER